MKHAHRSLALASLVVLLGACKDRAAIARADTLQRQLSEQEVLSNKLAEQKDSLTRVVLDADAFLGQMDSAISTVKGLPRNRRTNMDPLAAQVAARQEMMDRVNALVARAKSTANQLAELQRKEAATSSENARMAAKIESDAQMIADLGATIERQNLQIATLQARLDSLGSEIASLGARHYQAYYVIGTEQELISRGVAVKEGGANLIIARPGRTLVPARVLNPEAFSAIDQRQVTEIQVPDTTKRYRIISRQNLDDAEAQARDGNTFKGNLKITKPDEFWGASRFLILLKT